MRTLQSVRWQHCLLMIVGTVGLFTYPVLLLYYTEYLAYTCLLVALGVVGRPYLSGACKHLMVPVTVKQADNDRLGDHDDQKPRVTLLHSGADLVNPALCDLSSFVHTSPNSVLLISQWLYYLNPLLVLWLEMCTGVRVSYLRDFRVRSLLAAGHHVIVTPGGSLENVSCTATEQSIVLCKYSYWESIRDEFQAELKAILVYGGTQALWYQPASLRNLRTWMAQRDFPTVSVLYPRFPASHLSFRIRHIPLQSSDHATSVETIKKYVGLDKAFVPDNIAVRIIRQRVPAEEHMKKV